MAFLRYCLEICCTSKFLRYNFPTKCNVNPKKKLKDFECSTSQNVLGNFMSSYMECTECNLRVQVSDH